MSVRIGEAVNLGKILDVTIAEKYFSRRMREEKVSSPWDIRLWHDGVNNLWAVRADGLENTEVEAIKETVEIDNPYGGRAFKWCPLIWNRSRGENAWKPVPFRRRVFAGSKDGWERMNLGEFRLVTATWPNLRTSILTQMERRNLAWTFSIRERADLLETPPISKLKPSMWEVTRVA